MKKTIRIGWPRDRADGLEMVSIYDKCFCLAAFKYAQADHEGCKPSGPYLHERNSGLHEGL